MSCKDEQVSSADLGNKNFEGQSRRVQEVRKKLRRSLSESSIIRGDAGGTPDNKLNSSNSNIECTSLYAKVRQNLHKVNRISKSALSLPKTPSKPGVYAETIVGKFAQVKSLFDRRCRGTGDGPSTKNSIADRMKMANSVVRRFANKINSATKPRRLYDSEFSSPDRVTFNTRKGTVKMSKS